MEHPDHSWLPEYAQQMELRPSVLHQTNDYHHHHHHHHQESLPDSTTISQTVAQHPELVAQLTSGLHHPPPQAHHSEGHYNPEEFQFNNSFAHGQLFNQCRPSVVQQAPQHFDAFNAPLFPFPNYFGLPGCVDGDSHFNEETVQHKEATAPLFPQDDTLFNHFNALNANYCSVSLEAMLKEKKECTETAKSKDLTPRIAQECQVCQATQSNGLHFGARTCAACAAFFRRTISDSKKYTCKRSQRCNNTQKDATGYRKICRACRLKRCMDIGMLPENVQHKRSRIDSPSRFDPSRTIDTHAPHPSVTSTASNDTPPVLNRFDDTPVDRPSLEVMFPFYSQLAFHPPEDGTEGAHSGL